MAERGPRPSLKDALSTPKGRLLLLGAGSLGCGSAYLAFHLGREIRLLDNFQYCREDDNILSDECSRIVSDEDLQLPLLYGLSETAHTSIKPKIQETLAIVSSVVKEGRLSVRQVNNPRLTAGQLFSTRIENWVHYDLIIPPYDSLTSEALGAKFHESFHLTRREDEIKNGGKFTDRSPEEVLAEENQAQYLEDYIEALARKSGYPSPNAKVDMESYGIDLPTATQILVNHGVGPESKLYGCITDLAYRYLSKSEGFLDDIGQDALRSDSSTAERRVQIEEIEQRCGNPLGFIPKGSTEWDAFSELRLKGIFAPDFFPNLPQENGSFYPARLDKIIRLAFVKGFGFGTTSGVRTGV